MVNETYVTGTSQASIASIVPLSIHNKIHINPLYGAKPNEPSWPLLQIPPIPPLIQTMHLWKFRKQNVLYFINVHLGY